MAKNVVAFKLSDANAQRILREIAAESDRVKFTVHALNQMVERKITRIQVINCLKHGAVAESPVLDHHGNWKLTMHHFACGERIGCAVAFNLAPPQRAIVITAFWVR